MTWTFKASFDHERSWSPTQKGVHTGRVVELLGGIIMTAKAELRILSSGHRIRVWEFGGPRSWLWEWEPESEDVRDSDADAAMVTALAQVPYDRLDTKQES
jgi:hypothetical protein